MPNIKKLIAVVCTMAGVIAAPHASAAEDAAVTPLLEKPFKNLPGKEGLMILVEYPPGAIDPVHRHDAHGFIYVLEGSIVMGVKGGKEQTLTPGQTFYEGPEDIHTVGRNASATKPAKFLVFLVKEKKKPVLILVK
ncbi:MAG: cupin domain-containing protein [Pseudomonadota bacterium]